jgi:hypothetical protein
MCVMVWYYSADLLMARDIFYRLWGYFTPIRKICSLYFIHNVNLYGDPSKCHIFSRIGMSYLLDTILRDCKSDGSHAHDECMMWWTPPSLNIQTMVPLLSSRGQATAVASLHNNHVLFHSLRQSALLSASETSYNNESPQASSVSSCLKDFLSIAGTYILFM